MRRTALKIRFSRETGRLGSRFNALFGKPFAQSLAGLKTPDGFVNLVRVGYLGFDGRA